MLGLFSFAFTSMLHKLLILIANFFLWVHPFLPKTLQSITKKISE